MSNTLKVVALWALCRKTYLTLLTEDGTIPTMTTQTLIRANFRIPLSLDAKIDKAWARLRAKGVKESKQAFAARLLEDGLSAQKTSSAKDRPAGI